MCTSPTKTGSMMKVTSASYAKPLCAQGPSVTSNDGNCLFNARVRNNLDSSENMPGQHLGTCRHDANSNAGLHGHAILCTAAGGAYAGLTSLCALEQHSRQHPHTDT